MNKTKYTLAEVIKLGINNMLLDLNTALPGEIQSYDKTTQTAQVKIAIDRKIDGEVLKYPILDDIPVIFPRGKNFSFSFPLAKGDGCLLVFNQRNINKYRAVGSGQIPNDGRKFSISDAVVFPGFMKDSQALLPAQKDGLEIRGKKIAIGDPSGPGSPLASLSSSDLVQAMAKIIEQLLSLPLISSMGPVNFDPSVVLALTELQTMIEGFEP